MADYRDATFLVKDSLIIIEPAYKFTTWTEETGGRWEAPAPSNSKGTFYIPISIYMDGDLMTEVGSKSAVTADDEWYYENGVVYVYGNHTLNFMVMYFQRYFGNRGWKLPKDLDLSGSADEVYFEPRISGNPNFARTQKDRLFGISVNGEANFTLLDTEDSDFDILADDLETYSFINKNVFIYRYLSEDSTKDIQLIFKGTIANWSINLTSVQFSAKDYNKTLDSHVQSVEYDTTTYPDCDPNYVNKIKRLIYGGPISVRCVNVDYEEDSPTTAENRVWIISENVNKSVSHIWIQDKKITTQYSLNGDKNQITFTAAVESTYSLDILKGSEEVYAVVEGKESGGSLIEKGADIVKDVLLTTGFTTADLNTASFTQAAIDNTYKCALALPQTVDEERPTARDTIERVNKSCLGFLTNDADFKLVYKIYASGSSARTLDKDIDLMGRVRNADTTDLASLVVLAYDFDERLMVFKTTSTTNDTAKYFHNDNRSHTIESVVRLLADAESLRDDYSTYFGQALLTEDFRLKLQLEENQLGDFATVDGNLVEIVKLDRSINDAAVTVRRT